MDFELEDKVFRWVETIYEGRIPEEGEVGIVIGSWMAEDHEISVGDYLMIQTKTAGGMYQVLDAEVMGIVDTQNPVINRGSVFFPLDYIQNALLMENQATGISVLAETPDTWNKVETIAGENSLVALTFQELEPGVMALYAGKSGGSFVILGLMFLIAAIGVTNNMLLAMYERTTEIGTLRAMGMNNSEVRTVFTFEGFGIGLFGSLIGILFGVLINLFMVEVGIDYSFLLRSIDAGYRITGVMQGEWSMGVFIIGPIFGILVSGFVALLATGKATKTSITTALRSQ